MTWIQNRKTATCFSGVFMDSAPYRRALLETIATPPTLSSPGCVVWGTVSAPDEAPTIRRPGNHRDILAACTANMVVNQLNFECGFIWME